MRFGTGICLRPRITPRIKGPIKAPIKAEESRGARGSAGRVRSFSDGLRRAPGGMGRLMARPALSATRAMAILGLLAQRPGRSLQISEIARELDINIASTHAILATLCEGRFVVREDARKTYRLGEGAIGIGAAALEQQPIIRFALREAPRLAERFGCECLTTVRIGSEIMVVGAAGRPHRLAYIPHAGQRIPFRPPIGILLAGSLSEDEREAWLGRMPADATPELKARYRGLAESAMRRGYEVGLESATREAIRRTLDALDLEPESPRLREELRSTIEQLESESREAFEIDSAAEHAVNNVVGLLRDPAESVVAGWTLTGFDVPLSAAEIRECGEALIATASRITWETRSADATP